MRDCAQPTKSTGLASSSIPPQSALWAQVKNRTESHRPRATRFKAPSHHRGPGYPACGDTDRRQPKRRHSTSIAGRGYSAHQRQAWQTAIEASGRSGRQRLRPRQIPTSTACRRHCNRNRSTRSASWKRAGQNTLGRGADHFVASQLPPTAHPLRTARFHTRGFPQNRLLHHMLAAAAKVILLTPLNALVEFGLFDQPAVIIRSAGRTNAWSAITVPCSTGCSVTSSSSWWTSSMVACATIEEPPSCAIRPRFGFIVRS